MTLEIQFKLKENPAYLKYLRSHSYWYKYLNRNPNLLKEFILEVKREYKLTKTDKLIRTLETIEMMEKVMNTLK